MQFLSCNPRIHTYNHLQLHFHVRTFDNINHDGEFLDDHITTIETNNNGGFGIYMFFNFKTLTTNYIISNSLFLVIIKQTYYYLIPIFCFVVCIWFFERHTYSSIIEPFGCLKIKRVGYLITTPF